MFSLPGLRRVDSLEKTLMLGGIGAGREGDDRGWDGWVASPTRRTWVWVNSGSWWWTGRPGVLRFMGSESDTTERLNWTELNRGYPFISLRMLAALLSGDSKTCTAWELRVKFYMRKNQDRSPGYSTSDSSEKLLQRGSGRRWLYTILVKGEFNASST